MGGLLKADLKKLSKSKCFIVCLVIAAVLGAAMAMLYNYIWEQSGKNIAMSYALMEYYGFSTDMLDEALSSLPKRNLWSYVNIFFSDSSIWILAAICVCTYISAEYSAGTFKNTIARGCKRMNIYFSKLIVAVIEIMSVALVYVGAGSLTALFFVDINSDFSAGNMILMVVTYILLMIATVSVYMMLSVIFRKTGIAVAVSIAAPLILATLLNLVTMANESLANLSRFLLMSTYVEVESLFRSGEGYIAVSVALAYMVVSTVIGCLIFSRSEVK